MHSPKGAKLNILLSGLVGFSAVWGVLCVSLALSMLPGCTEESRKEWFPSASEAAQTIRYVKDNRTGLCFVYNAVSTSNGGGTIYTNVPCSPEVERLVEK